MSKQTTTKGKTSRSLPVFIQDTTSTTGGGLSGVTSASSGLVLEYRRQGQSSWTSVTPVAGKTLGTYLSGGIVADGSLSGAYEVDFPDAAFASAAGVEWVACRIRGVANMLPVLIEVQLDAVDYQDSTAFGLSRLDQTISSRASQTSVDTLSSYVDTEVAAIKAKTDNLPVQPAAVSDIPTANQNRDAVMNAMPNGGWTAGSFGDRWIISNNSNRTIGVTGSGSGHVQCDVHALQPEVINSAAIAAGALNGKGDWLTTLGANAPANWINAAAIATDAIDADALADGAKNEIANAVAALQVLIRLDSMIESDGAGQFRFDTIAVSLASQGGGGGAVNISVEDQSITVC